LRATISTMHSRRSIHTNWHPRIGFVKLLVLYAGLTMHPYRRPVAKTKAEYGSFRPMMSERRTIEHSPQLPSLQSSEAMIGSLFSGATTGSGQSRILAAQQQFDGPVGMSSGVAQGFRDVVVAVEAQQADGGVAQGHPLWTAAGAVLGVVFGVGDV